MARTRAPGRLHEILDAALAVFSEVGYRRARMHDVAVAAHVSPGLLYRYASGKQALFALVLRREAGVDVDALDLPVSGLSPDALTELIGELLGDLTTMPALEAAERAAGRPKDPDGELRAIVGELYDAVSRRRRLLRLVERCALDWPALAEAFYVGTRRRYVERLGTCIARRETQGAYSVVPDPEVAARFVVESVSWFANHRFGDHDGAAIDGDIARATVVDLVTHAFVSR